MSERLRRMAPLSGVIFVGLTVAALSLPSAPDTGASGAKVISFFESHRTSVRVQEFLLAYGALFAVVYFTTLAGYLRRRGADVLATLTIAGSVLFATGLLIGAGLSEALADRASRLSPDSAQTLNLLQNDVFAFALFAGLAIATTSAGVAMLLTRAMPKALGIITTIVGIVAATTIGSWFAFLASGPLTLVIVGYLLNGMRRPEQITLPDVPRARADSDELAADRTKTAH